MSPTSRRVRGPRFWIVSGVVLCGLAGTLLVYRASQQNFPQLLIQAEQAWQRDDYSQTLSWAERALVLQPGDQRASLFAGLACQQLGQPERALRYLEDIDDQAPFAVKARQTCGEICLHHLHRPTAAYAHYQRLLKLDPQNLQATQQLAYLLGLAGRGPEAEAHRLILIRLQQIEPVLLYLLGAHRSLLENVEDLDQFRQRAPDDLFLAPGLARQAVEQGRTAEALLLLRARVQESPQDVAAQVELGRLVRADQSQFSRWYQDLPDTVRQSDGVWSLLGMWAMDHGDSHAAARCFWEELRIDPSSVQANYQLGRWLSTQGNTEQADLLLKRAELLEHYESLVTLAWTGSHPSAVEEAAHTAEKLGLIWEAYGWSYLMSQHFPDTAWADEALVRLNQKIPALSPLRTTPESNPAAQLDLSRYPLPSLSDELETAPRSAQPVLAGTSASNIHFADQALELGMDFRFFNGSPRDQQTRRMQEFNGGGVAVLDYDCDGWPDLFLTQGAAWPASSGTEANSDRLFRKAQTDRFHDVTESARLVDQQFSAGVAVGDLDNDGFPDLYVANIGPNRMLLNNGDGTFREITIPSGTAGDDWSTSAAIADLNGDQFPDLYVVNYLSGDDLFERLCRDEHDLVRSCSPRDFAAAQDRLYLSQGDGRFSDATETAGVRVPDGKGLGVTVADFSGSGLLDIFVANDAVPNFYFVNQGNSHTGTPRMSEEALLRGLALNEAGRAEACMGIAVGDANGDSRFDLFVTNFYNETNTLYQQTAVGDFQDATRAAHLAAPSLKMLGFGTQFFDPDRDGDLDLLVANGHIDNLSDTGVPYEMPAQVFQNDGLGHFTEPTDSTLGAYFGIRQLGRAVAILDWNRDGLEDVAITHLDTPATLLTNQSHPVGNALRLNLRGTASSRDAIGTRVTVEVNGRTLTRQLTAGDGFQASNQRQLVVGIGTATQIDRLTVRWPQGSTLITTSVPINTECLLIEGRDTVLAQP